MLAILLWTAVAVAGLGLMAKLAAYSADERERARRHEAHAFEARVAAAVRAELARQRRSRRKV